MAELHNVQTISDQNKVALRELARAIKHSQGRFSLTLIRCDYEFLQERILGRLRELCPIDFQELSIPRSAKTLYNVIREELGGKHPPALIILGLEHTSIEDLLISANQVRDEFRKSFPFPLVLWVNDETLKKLVRLAPDFNNWAGVPVRFEISTEELLEVAKQGETQIFSIPFDMDRSEFLQNPTFLTSNILPKFDVALKALKSHEQKLEPSLNATLEFILGQDALVNNEFDIALSHFQNSLAFWKRTKNFKKQAIVLFYIGLCYSRQAELEPIERQNHWKKARNNFELCIDFFRRTEHSDLVDKVSSHLGKVLRYQKDWNSLHELARNQLELHQKYSDPIGIAEDYGFLAEIALESKGDAEEAIKQSQQALMFLAQAPKESQQIYEGLFLLLLAQAQQQTGHPEEAIQNLEKAKQNLEKAKQNCYLQDHVKLHIRILQELQSLYFAQGQQSETEGQDLYLRAFRIEQALRSVEQQYGLRAFIGADSLKPQKKTSGSIRQFDDQMMIAPEIVASGRQQDVHNLIERISSTDRKLIIIHGQSGVGKTSIIDAGLIPTLKQKFISTRRVLPIRLRNYSNWVEDLSELLTYHMHEMNGASSLCYLNSVSEIINYLRSKGEANFLIVLIFDQFEEFFFVCKNQSDRLAFFEFLSNSLSIPYVKVILSLREDYLSNLLEFERICSRSDNDALNNLLSKEVRYYIGNLSVENAKSVIQNLTKLSQFRLEPQLINELVKDLAADSGEVRPIELQVVGAQLQAREITSLEKYRRLGARKGLVGRFLDEVIKNCGHQNERTARLVLSLLSDKNGARLIRSRTELASNIESMGFEFKENQLDLVLEVLVGSGLVFLMPKEPADNYQLIHDYLVTLINKQPSIEAELIAAQKNKQFEEQLREELAASELREKQLKKELKQAGERLDRLYAEGFAETPPDENIDDQTDEEEAKAIGSFGLGQVSFDAVVFLVQSISKIVWGNYKRLESPLKETLVKASRRYLQYYRERYGILKVLGMRKPVSLESIYTKVQFLEAEAILSFETIEALEQSYRHSKNRGFQLSDRRKQAGIQVANQKKCLMVLGSPSVGKSIFLRKMGLEALKGQQGTFQHQCIPVYLELKRFRETNIDIEQYIAQEFETCGFPEARQFTQKALEQGKLLILLDGLDEVPVANLNNAITIIHDFVDRHSKNRFIASCRTAAYHNYFHRFTNVEIAEFDDAQIQQFIGNWFQSDLDQQMEIAQRCWKLLQKPENAAAKELAQTPLLLTFLCLVYDRSQNLPDNRSTLYRKALDILLEEWAAEKRIQRDAIYPDLHIDLEKALL